jgi:hypothetical protein
VILRDITSQTPSGEILAGHKGAVRTLAFSPDGKILASGGFDHKVILWDIVTKQRVVELQCTSHVLSVTFSPDGKILASGTRAGNISLWDVASRQELGGELKHKRKVRGVVFSPDGRTLASASDDKTAMLWDVATRKALRLILESQQPVLSVAFSPDGETLALGSGELAFRIVRFEEMQARASNVAARNLTQEEWRRFLGNEPYRFTSPDAALLEAHRLALAGDTPKAEKAFQALVPWSVKTNDFVLNKRVGWYGSLDGFAKIVLPACEAAVELPSKRTQPYYRSVQAKNRDTRGLARTLAGDTAGAIEDFEAVVGWAEQRHWEDNVMPEEWVRQRCEWLPELKAGRNPFDSATRRALLRDG